MISLGSAKLSVDSAGDGAADEGGVVEGREGGDDSLMFNTPPNGACLTPSDFEFLFVRFLIRSGKTPLKDRHVQQLVGHWQPHYCHLAQSTL